MFFTDIEFPAEYPENVKFIHMPFERMMELAIQKSGIDMTWRNPYKFCDLKPLYGILFSDYLKEYDYWGHADIDLFMGDVMQFIKKLLDENFDIISSRRGIVAGPFSLFRNVDNINTLYKHIPKIQELIQSSESHYIDEQKMFALLQQPQYCHNVKCYFEEMLTEDALNKMRGRKRWLLIWNNGQLYDLQLMRKTMLFHFIDTKRNKEFVNSFTHTHIRRFYFTEKGLLEVCSLFNVVLHFVAGYYCSYRYIFKRFVKRHFLGIKDF